VSITNLDVPWATTPPPVVAPAEITGVDVLPGFAAGATRATDAKLSQPWSGQKLATAPQPGVSDLIGMLLSD
jgi:hypothetical protein